MITANTGWRFDIMKLVLAVMVVAIHTGIGIVWLRPLLRSAVPLFFTLSSFFFFLYSDWKRTESMQKYLLRIVRLFLFWFALLLIPSAFIGQWFWNGFSIQELYEITVKKLVFGGDIFKASWYLSASFFGMPIVWGMAKKRLWLLLTIVSILCFTLCYLSSNFYGLLNNNCESINDLLPDYTFIVAIPWLSLGLLFSKWTKNSKSMSWMLLLAIVSFALLYVERAFIDSLGCRRVGDAFDDCYLSMIPFCVGVFSFVSSMRETKLLDLRVLRRISTIIYCCHGTISILIPTILRNTVGYDMPWGIWLFLSTLVSSLIVALIILKLENNRHFSWLRYSH